MKSRSIRIALVKQDVYQDLYVSGSGERDPASMLFSSTNRVGPIGLFTLLGADFYIVREEQTPECQVYRRVIPHLADQLQLLKTRRLDQIPGHEFFRPGSQQTHADFSVNCYDVAWGAYDVVISVNVSLPKRLVRKFPRTLFCYMIGEANLFTKRVRFGYDVCLNQEARGRIATKPGVVDFPYTFVGARCLELLLLRHLKRTSEQSGIYAEINSCPERPVTSVPPAFRSLEPLGHPVRLHRQRISENLAEIYDAKYFLKLGGRKIRGNSVIEAISLGTLALIDPDSVTHRELLPRETWVRSVAEARQRIQYLDEYPPRYQALLAQQRQRLEQYVAAYPIVSMRNCLEYKRRKLSRPIHPTFHPATAVAESTSKTCADC